MKDLKRHLVLMPGLDGTGDLFEPFLEVLPGHFNATIIRYPTEASPGYAGLDSFVMDRLPTDREFIIIAESFSGPIAIQVGSKRPRGLRAIILCASFSAAPVPSVVRILKHVVSERLFRLAPPNLVIRALMTGFDASDELCQVIRRSIRRVNPDVLAARLRDVLDVDVSPDLTECRVPILYLRGSNDRLVGSRGWNQVRARSGAATCVDIDGPHLLLQTRPLESMSAIDRFINSLAAS